MPSARQEKILPYSPQQMFRLVADVESYPQFLPWCRALRVIEKELSAAGDGFMVAEMLVSYAAFRQSYKSHITLDTKARTIKVAYLEGPFNSLQNLWRFSPHPHGVMVYFLIDFSFKNGVLEKLSHKAFEYALTRMIDSFEKRAHQLYG